MVRRIPEFSARSETTPQKPRWAKGTVFVVKFLATVHGTHGIFEVVRSDHPKYQEGTKVTLCLTGVIPAEFDEESGWWELTNGSQIIYGRGK